ncbi:MFS transporter [Streptomyces sp. NPDC059639]|uniref:MFS transporter n=1 Tax=Streptomyces sp. NPDC059639 TaxID=3346891 RepID=UPI0036C9391B
MTTTVPESPRSPTPGSSKAPGTDNGPATGRGRLLAVVLAAQFMAVLDVFIVNVAAPTIRTDLDASGAALQLIVAGYTITYAVLLITGARLGDLFGHRRAVLGGLALFTAASLACGLAQSGGQLIAFRMVQGAGAALLVPQVLSLVQRHFAGEARTRALGLYAAVLAVGAAAGQVLGGLLVGADLFGTGWRAAFLVNVPVGAALLVLGRGALPADAGRGAGRRLDLVGLVLLGGSVSLLTVPLVLGQEEDWPLWSWLCLASCAVLFALFRGYESALARRGGAPLIAPRVLRLPGIRLAAFQVLAVMAVNAGYLFALTLHIQSGLGYGPLRAGLTVAPTAVAFGAVGLTWRRWPARWQRALIPAGFGLAAAGALGTGLALHGGGDGGAGLYLAFVVIGAGLALAFSPTLTGALATVRPEDAADASGLLTTVTQLGMLIGVAGFGTLFLGRVETERPLGAYSSSDALLICAYALAAVAGAGAVSGLVRRRR